MNLFDVWNRQKQIVHDAKKIPGFAVRQVWWVQFGKNVGTEVLGKGENFLRPAVVIKKTYGGNSCVVVPLTRKKKTGNYYFCFSDSFGQENCALLPQVRYIDARRLKRFHTLMSSKDFLDLEEALIKFIATKNNPQSGGTGGDSDELSQTCKT